MGLRKELGYQVIDYIQSHQSSSDNSIIMPDSETQKIYTLTTHNLFKHFLLLHDFMYEFTKTKAISPQHLDTQLDVTSIMNRATLIGSRLGQAGSFITFITYCLKSQHIGRKFVFGFLYAYWINHFATLGSYLVVMVRMPQVYSKVGDYYAQQEPSPNKLDLLEDLMANKQDYEDTHDILAQIFPEIHKSAIENYLSNDYFARNKQKYGIHDNMLKKNSLRLPYLDSFLTRYIYYSFTRWLSRVKLMVGLVPE